MADKELEKEKQRKLTEREAARLANFEQEAAKLEAQGYQKKEMAMSVVKANVMAFVLSIPFIVVALVLFFLLNKEFTGITAGKSLIYFVLYLVLVIVHELIHGMTWSFFTPEGWKDIEFGVIVQYLTPYCTCKAPLAKTPYIIGTLMPLIVLGILPTIYAIFSGSLFILLVGIVMIVSAGGDMAIVLEMLKYKTTSQDVKVFDHPTQVGFYLFEK